MTKIEKMHTKLNEEFRHRLHKAFKEKFDREIETNFNIFSMNLVTSAADGKKLTQKQYDFIAAYSDGYAAAMIQVRE